MSVFMSKKALVQGLYVDRSVPGPYLEFYPWIMGKSEFHWLYENWLYRRMSTGMEPDIQVGASLSDCRVIVRANYVEPKKSLERATEKHIEGILEGEPVVKERIKAKAKKSRKPRSPSMMDWPVVQYDMDMNKIKEYESMRVMQDETGIPGKAVIDVCNGRRMSTYKYKWKFKNRGKAIIK